ncbi:glycosyltransferase [bacterium]|nr:glycosyltransferase [bacterium]MBU1984635.1 glycosyltransferase [bacterium]
MKIVLFGPTLPFRGGVPQFTSTLTERLHAAGHDVKIVGFRELFPKLLFSGRMQDVGSPPASDVPTESVFNAWQPASWKRTARIITAHSPDLILAMWWMPLFAPGYRAVLRALSSDLRARWIFVIHDVVSHERFPGDTLLSRSALRHGTRFLALSSGQEKALRKLLPNLPDSAVTMQPHPVYDNYRRFRGTAEEAREQLGVKGSRVLLFFGFVRRYKGLDILLRAMPEILRHDPNTRLLIAGPFHHARTHYERLIEKLGIRRTVVIHDRYFSGDDVGMCFAAADVVVLPYRSATQSGVIPIAFALGVPVIATRVEGIEEYVRDGETGLLVPPEDPTALANAVEQLFDRSGTETFASAITEEAARYSWAGFIENIAAQT